MDNYNYRILSLDLKKKQELIDAHTKLLIKYKKVRDRLSLTMKLSNLTIEDLKMTSFGYDHKPGYQEDVTETISDGTEGTVKVTYRNNGHSTAHWEVWEVMPIMMKTEKNVKYE